FIDFAGRECCLERCGRPFLTIDRRRQYCSSRCARHDQAVEANRRRRALDAAAKRRRLMQARRALRLLKRKPANPKRWLAKRARLSVNWVTRNLPSSGGSRLSIS